ncbi:phosphoadenosine phosphosulfate reductase family protein [Aquibacillus sp. 3ASR75-11]|uniref:Phosphoadenosine phosphosulfate reductase family protein n=1 Tax=Terrihalobacillus insolitus TaxID=2950438 RepID=A0A9X3WUQ6_9BACI|nr:phosphoadenosine phosphosulfate reductase family protein [Terrihalobacillus insolitus]MDC3424366.1 phosphoadenosine phosphosulfate reductase family protein [Terrihalobacillus insolitus]
MNTIEKWKKRVAEINVFQEFDNIIEILTQEYLNENSQIPWVISFSGGKDSSLVLTLIWKTIMKIPVSKRKRKVHIVMSDTAVETPVMQNYQHTQLEKIRQSAQEQGLSPVVKIHMVRPPIKSRFFYKIIGRGTPSPSPNARSRYCTFHMKITPIQKKMEEIIREAVQEQDCLTSDEHAIVSILGVRLKESQSRAGSIRKFEVDELYATHASDKRIKVMHPIKKIDLDSLWSYLENLPNGVFPYGGTVHEMMKQYGKTGFECGIKDGSEGEGKSCGQAGSRSGCWTCPLMSGEDKMLSGLIEEGYEEYHHLQEWKDYMKAIRNDVRFRLPTQRQKFNSHEKKALIEKESSFSLFSSAISDDIHEKRRHLYDTFGRASFRYAPGALTIEARKRLLEYLLWVQERVGVTLIEKDELEAIYDTWKDDGYCINPFDVKPTRYTHKERLILSKDGTVNEKETTVNTLPLFYVKIQTKMSESEFVTYVQNKVRETNKSIPYLSQVLDYEKEEIVFNEFIFIVCSPFATSQREADHHVFSWLDWKDSFDYEKYDPPYEGWEPEDEGLYLPKQPSDRSALSDHLVADKIIQKIKDSDELSSLWQTADGLNSIKGYVEKLKLLEIIQRTNNLCYEPITNNPPELIEQVNGQLSLAI